MTDEREPEKAPSEDATAATSEPEVAAKVAAADAVAQRRVIRWWWFLLAALVIEFWLYGRRGHIEVCVGKDGETDFSLVGSERTDENRWEFPRCEQRTNLGLTSHFDEATEEATRVACRGATIFRHQGETKVCVAQDKGWVHRTTVSHCPPWHDHFYEHLFWFLH